MESSSAFSTNDFRRKWDRDLYRERNIKRHGKWAPPIKREFLHHRDYTVDLESKVGQTILIYKTTPQAEMGGFYCKTCDCMVRDSINFLNHINGKKHQRNLGMSMHVETSSLDSVKKRLELNRKKIEEKPKEYDFEERMKELRQKEKRKKRKHRAEEDCEEMAVMGFSSFGGSKKNH
ncbi:zinc finger matrin-type protein 2-like [Gouania willdenowi]|uniref:zinc finger matrin-type protein 2-like n=1 Tax=Gouania willdenowi TaxID=441366 RepID=UPI00105696BA|nr:zinc finger matrin-type protein 2-like [Gouania willdenowi]